MRILLSATGSLLAAVLLAGCGSSSTADDPGPTTTTTDQGGDAVSYPTDAPPLTDAERSWPMSGQPLSRGRVYPLTAGLKLGVVSVAADTAVVQVWEGSAQAAAQTVTLRLGYPEPVKGITLRLLSASSEATPPSIGITVGVAGEEQG